MFDQLAKSFRIGVNARVSESLRRASPVALTAVLFAAIGLAWPLQGSPTPDAFSPSPDIDPAASAGGGELDGFLAMARWGRPAYDAEAARRAAEEAERLAREAALAGGINPVLAELGVIGISTAGDSHAVLLTEPDVDLVRLTVGDALPDGRVLVSVAANSLVLEDAYGGREELLLFPRFGEDVLEAAADEGPP